MPIHKNSIASFYGFDHDSREGAVIRAFVRPMTDREIMQRLGFVDMNTVRPSITKLTQLGVLEEVGTAVCPVTDREVRVSQLVPKHRFARKKAKRVCIRVGPKTQSMLDDYCATHTRIAPTTVLWRALRAYVQANP